MRTDCIPPQEAPVKPLWRNTPDLCRQVPIDGVRIRWTSWRVSAARKYPCERVVGISLVCVLSGVLLNHGETGNWDLTASQG